MGILSWIILGGLAGWLGSIVMGTNARMGAIANVVVGVIGSVIGGWIFSHFGGYGVTGFNLHSLFVSFVGACATLGVAKLILK